MKVEKYLQDNFGLPPTEKLESDFACFYDSSIVQPAHLYLTKKHFCLHIHGQGKDLVIPWCDITQMEKRNTARIIPNAVEIYTASSIPIFLCFLNRRTPFKTIRALWTGKVLHMSALQDDHSPAKLLEAEAEVKVNPAPIESVYSFKKELGSGAFSVVKLAKHKATKEMRAIKIVDKKEVKDNKERLEQEVEILKRIQHPNIISLLEIFETPQYLYLVMELATGGELFDSIVKRGHYSEKDAARIIRQVTEACAYLHRKGIVHRDLKPENLLLANKTSTAKVKIADFGLSKTMQDAAILQTSCGTPGYVAPEILIGRGYHKEVDVWSIGVIMYVLLCGFPPFHAENNNLLFERIMAGKYHFPSAYWSKVSKDAKKLVKRMLVVNPKERITTIEILEHPWIQGNVGDQDLTEILKELKKTREDESKHMDLTASSGSVARLAIDSV